ncbi:MAG TPA: hypothetical protein VM553_16280, partial [Dongiaceae bacterium]|nr:hypothetical protein [Dongiaceae bacterium]
MKPASGFAFPVLTLATLFLLSGCGGGGSSNSSGSNDTSRAATDSGSSTADTAFDSAAFFQARIQPRLTFCATCHVAGGLADTDEGDGLLLSSNSAQHYDDFHASWRELGEGTTNNPLLTKNALMSEVHSGGKSWPVGSEAYTDVSTLFGCWDDPESCAGETEEPPVVDDNDLPLLDPAPVKAPMVAGCEGKPDDTPLPLDPRSLVVEGVNKPGLAVQFNAYWVDVHNPLPPYRANPLQRAQTCGEWKARVAEGEYQVKFGSRFMGGLKLFTPRNYRLLWKSWGLKERPDNFDEEIIKRYGLVKADFR